MGDAAGQLAHRLHLLRLPESFLGPVKLLRRQDVRGDVAADGVEDAVAEGGVGHGGPGEGHRLAVGFQQPHLELVRRLSGHQPRHHLAGQRQVFRMDDVGERPREKLGLGPVQGLGPGRVDRFQIAVEAGDPDQVLAELEDPLPLGLGGDLLLHPVGDLDRGDQHPAYARGRRGIGDGAVAQGEASIVPTGPMPLDAQRYVLSEDGRRSALQQGGMDRLDLVPDFRPGLARRPAEGPGMLVAEDRAIGVVVEKHEVRAPPQRHRKGGGEHDLRRQLQARRPVPARSQKGGRPVVGVEQGPRGARRSPPAGRRFKRRGHTLGP